MLQSLTQICYLYKHFIDLNFPEVFWGSDRYHLMNSAFFHPTLVSPLSYFVQLYEELFSFCSVKIWSHMPTLSPLHTHRMSELDHSFFELLDIFRIIHFICYQDGNRSLKAKENTHVVISVRLPSSYLNEREKQSKGYAWFLIPYFMNSKEALYFNSLKKV